MRQSWDKRLRSHWLQTPDSEWKQNKPTHFYHLSLFSTIFWYIFPQTDAEAGGQPGSACPTDRAGSSPLLFRQQKLARWSLDHWAGHRAMVVSVSFIPPLLNSSQIQVRTPFWREKIWPSVSDFLSLLAGTQTWPGDLWVKGLVSIDLFSGSANTGERSLFTSVWVMIYWNRGRNSIKQASPSSPLNSHASVLWYFHKDKKKKQPPKTQGPKRLKAVRCLCLSDCFL